MKKILFNKVLILGIVFIPFFIYKSLKLSDYNKYRGKVIDIEAVTISVPKFKGLGGSEIRYIPVVEYYTKKDTSSFSEGKLNYFSSYNIGDKITVLERKDNPYKANILSFWYYFLSIPELIILSLTNFVIYGFYKTFINKKS